MKKIHVLSLVLVIGLIFSTNSYTTSLFNKKTVESQSVHLKMLKANVTYKDYLFAKIKIKLTKLKPVELQKSFESYVSNQQYYLFMTTTYANGNLNQEYYYRINTVRNDYSSRGLGGSSLEKGALQAVSNWYQAEQTRLTYLAKFYAKQEYDSDKIFIDSTNSVIITSNVAVINDILKTIQNSFDIYLTNKKINKQIRNKLTSSLVSYLKKYPFVSKNGSESVAIIQRNFNTRLDNWFKSQHINKNF